MRHGLFWSVALVVGPVGCTGRSAIWDDAGGSGGDGDCRSLVSLGLAGPSPIVVAQCSGPYAVTARDGAGRACPVASAIAVTVTRSGQAELFADAACAAPATGVTLAPGAGGGAGEGVFYLRGAVAEEVLLRAEAAGELAPATLVVTVANGARLELSDDPAYDFGATRVGSRAVHLVLVRNVGDYPARALGPSVFPFGSPFGYGGAGAGGTCVSGGALAPGEVCSLTLAFAPVAAGDFSDAINVGYADGLAMRSATRALTGRGTTLLRVRRVTVSDHFACAILTDGSARCWGRNYYDNLFFGGMLGTGDVEHRGDGPGEMGAALPPVALGTGRTVQQLASSYCSSCALLDDHRIKCWGANAYGELGLGDTEPRGDEPGEMGDALPYVELGTGRRVHAIAAGSENFCAILDDQTLKCWGANYGGALGRGDTDHRGDEPGEMGDALPSMDLGAGRWAKQVSGFESGLCAVLDDDRLKCWGGNSRGELGLGDTENRGDEPGEMGDALPYVDLGPGRAARRLLSSTQFHTCVILDDGSVKCWGENTGGQLGLGDTESRGDEPDEMGAALPPVSLGTGRTATRLLLGLYHTCAILDDDSLKCWGDGDRGALGQGDQAVRGDAPGEMGDALPTVNLGLGLFAVDGDAGTSFACVVLNDDTVKCWGFNSYGNLGLGNTAHRGDAAGEMGDALPRVDLGLD